MYVDVVNIAYDTNVETSSYVFNLNLKILICELAQKGEIVKKG